MPATTEKQRGLFGAALSFKRGKSSNVSASAKKIARTVSTEEIRKMASHPKPQSSHSSHYAMEMPKCIHTAQGGTIRTDYTRWKGKGERPPSLSPAHTPEYRPRY